MLLNKTLENPSTKKNFSKTTLLLRNYQAKRAKLGRCQHPDMLHISDSKMKNLLEAIRVALQAATISISIQSQITRLEIDQKKNKSNQLRIKCLGT